MKRILVIDEDVDWLSAMKSFFERSGYEPALAASYPEGYEMLGMVRPDLIFIDIKPRDPNGLLFYKKIRQEKEFSQIPIIITSHDMEASTLFQSYGEAVFLKKPFQLSRLLRTLRVYL